VRDKRKNRTDANKNVVSFLLDDEINPSGDAPNAPQTLNLGNLRAFTNHPFRLYEGDRLNDMIRSVKELGILLPIIVRPASSGDGIYEILSGHNRVSAANLAGLDEVPVIIKEGLTDDEAKLIVTETNLVQRSFADLSHSERAIALKTHFEALKASKGGQGRRTDLLNEIKLLANPDKINENSTSTLLEQKLFSVEKTGEKYGLSRASVARYVRISHLTKALLHRIDNNEIGLYPAVSLSYISQAEQDALNRLLDKTPHKIDMKKAETLRAYSEDGKLTEDKMLLILSGELGGKPKSKTAPPLKIKAKVYQKHFVGNYTQNEMESIIDMALTEYFQNHQQPSA